MSSTAVTPKIVQVPSVGNIQFPGDMPDDQISAAIQKNYPQLSAPKEPPAETLTPAQQMERAKSRTYSGTSIGPSESTFAQTHPIYQKLFGAPLGAAKRFAEGAGIPTSQAETTDAVQGMLTPQADPAEQDKLLRTEEQIPILGGDFRARADLAKKGDTRNAAIPFFGPANAAFAEKASKGDYAGAAGSALNAILSLEGLKGAVKPKAGPTEGLRAPSDVNQAALPPKRPGTYTGPPISGPPGVVAKTSAAATSKLLGGGEKAMQKAPIKQATAAGEATNAQVRDYAASKGIDLLPGQATQARGLQTLQAEGERAIVMPGELPEVLEKQKAAFGNAIDDFKTRVGTEAIPDTEAAGTSLKSQAQHGLNTLKESAQADYQGFQDKAGDIPVDLSDIKAKAQAAMASQAEALRNVPTEYATPIRNVLRKLSDLEAGPAVSPKVMADFQGAVEQYGLGPEQQAALRQKMGIPEEGTQAGFKMSTAQQLRSAYLNISRDYSGNVPKSVQRYAGQAAKDIDTAMAKAADSVGATEQWRQANSKWKQLEDTYNNPEHPLYKIIQEEDPSAVPGHILGKSDYGGSPRTIRQLHEAGIDLSPIKHEIVRRIAEKNFALTNGGTGLAGYSTKFLQTLFTPAEFQELTTMGRVGRAIKFEMNPSGTSNVAEGSRTLRAIIRHGGPLTAGAGAGFLLGGPVGALAGGVLAGAGDALVPSIASKITTSKAFARATMGDVGPVAQPRSLVDILGSRPPEPPTGAPPSSGAPIEHNQAPPAAPKAKGMAAQPRSLSDILGGQPERRSDSSTRKTVAAMTPEERAQALLTSDKTGLPNRRAFDEAPPSKAVAMSDADGLKALNDKFGYDAGDALLKAKADALKEAGLDAYHEKGDEFLYRGESLADLKAKLEQAREILKNKVISVEMKDGTVLQFKGADFSYGTGQDIATAETGLKAHKGSREASGERARGELRGITQLRPEAGQENLSGSAQADAGGNPRKDQQNPVAQPRVTPNSSVSQPKYKVGDNVSAQRWSGGVIQGKITDIRIENGRPYYTVQPNSGGAGYGMPEDKIQSTVVAQPSLSDIFSGKTPTDSYAQAKQLVAEFGKSSSSLLQRRLKIGYAEAVKYQDRMFKDGLVDRAGNGATWKGGK